MHSRARLWGMVAAATLLWGGHALAQTGGGGIGSPQAQSAYAEWRKLSQSEVNCVDQSLRGQGTRLWSLIQRGIGPSNAGIAKVRAVCLAQAKSQNSSPAHGAPEALASAAPDKVTVTTTVTTVTPDKAAADKSATDKAAAEKAAADKAAAEKAAASKAAADKIAADKAAADRAKAEKAAADKAAAEKAAAAKAAMDVAKAEAERAKAKATEAQPEATRPRREAGTDVTETALASSAAELRTSFMYGLAIGPGLFVLGGFAFLLMQRRRNASVGQSEAAKQKEFDNLVTAVLAEVKRRDRAPETVLSDRERRIADAAVH